MKAIMDTSVSVDHPGITQILIPNILIHYLEEQARKGSYSAELSIENLHKLRGMHETEFIGQVPRRELTRGEVNSEITKLAYENGAVLFTSDPILRKIADILGVEVVVPTRDSRIQLVDFFEENTMSVHIRENNYPYAKKGEPGNWVFEKIGKEILDKQKIKEMAAQLIENKENIEIEREGSTIVQLGNLRIVITKPPFSDGWEITAVRPVKLMELDEYNIDKKLMERIDKQAEGILIAGSPGQGKTTFARALALHYAASGKVVKTIEAPRDLILPETITQFAISHGSPEEIHDILLLSRPDYTVFDEMRNTEDFALFTDLRLSGVGMVGIVHATSPIDAIQRFIGRIELGVIPQIIDTVIFIKGGSPKKIFEISMKVKVPSGMVEADLARPIVTVNDFDTGKLEYEVYSYGEETVVIPVEGTSILGEDKAAHKLAAETLEKKFKAYSDNAKVEVTSDNRCTVFIPEEEIGKIIGKGGERISRIEKELGIKIDVEKLERNYDVIPFSMMTNKRHVTLVPEKDLSGEDVEIYVDGEFFMSCQVSKKNAIRVSRKSEQGKGLAVAEKMGKSITIAANRKA